MKLIKAFGRRLHKHTKQTKSKKRRKLKVVATALTILAIGILLVIRMLSGPAVGTITLLNQSAGISYKPSYIKYRGKYASFTYLNTYKLEKAEHQTEIVLDAYRLQNTGKLGTTSHSIAITIFSLPESKLENDSAYKYRKINPQLYLERVTAINGYEARFMKKRDGTELTVFIQKGDKLATIGFSGSISAPGAESEYNYVINSWKWR